MRSPKPKPPRISRIGSHSGMIPVWRYRASAAPRGRYRPASVAPVSTLGGAPGPLSARFGGPGLDDAGRVGALLDALANCSGEQRRARFVCVAALAAPEGELVTARGECAGHILDAPRGRSGFGYDPVFFVEEVGRAMAELPESEKNRISHRASAFGALGGAIPFGALGGAIRAQFGLAPAD